MTVDMFFKIFETVLTVALIMGIGYIAVKKGIADSKVSGVIANYLVTIAIPCTIISKLYFLGDLKQALIGITFASINQIISLAIGLALAKLFRVKKGLVGTVACSFAFANSGFVGMPIVYMLFGESAKNISIYYTISNNLVFWTIGAYFIKHDAMALGRYENDGKSALKKIINPPIITFMVMVVIVALNIKLPTFIVETADMLEGTTSPLAIIFCGMILGGIGIKNIKWQKGYSLIMLGRFIVTPLVMVAIFALYPCDDLFMKVQIVQSAMPVITLVEVAAKKYNADVEYASIGFVFSLLMLFVSLPLVYYIAVH